MMTTRGGNLHRPPGVALFQHIGQVGDRHRRGWAQRPRLGQPDGGIAQPAEYLLEAGRTVHPHPVDQRCLSLDPPEKLRC